MLSRILNEPDRCAVARAAHSAEPSSNRPKPRTPFAWPSLALALALALLSATAQAAEPPQVLSYELSWTRGGGADDCPSASVLQREVQSFVGPPATGIAERVFEALVERRGDRFGVTLRLRNGQGKMLGERELRSSEESCRSVLDATAFAIALSIDPERAVRRQAPPVMDGSSSAGPAETAPPRAAGSVPAAAPGPAEPLERPQPPAGDVPSASNRSPDSARAGDRELLLNAWAQAVVALGLLPSARLAPELGFGARWLRWSAQAGAGFYPKTGREGLNLRAGLTVFWLSGGYTVLARSSWTLNGDAGFGVGALNKGGTFTGNGDHWYGAFRLGAVARGKVLNDLSLEGSVQGVVPWWRPRLQANPGSSWEPPAVGLLVGAGVRWEPR